MLMSELLHNPSCRPPFEDQKAFFIELLTSARDAKADQSGIPAKRIYTGPLYEEFRRESAVTDAVLAELGVTFEHFKPIEYITLDTQKELYALPPDTKNAIEKEKQARLNRLVTIGDTILRPRLRAQTIDASELGHPPIAYMTRYRAGESGKLCFNACFRMIMHALTGWQATEGALAAATGPFNNNSMLAPDELYLDTLRTPYFADRVRVASFIGADLDFVSNMAGIIRRKRPDATVFALLNIGSPSITNNNVWHTALLGAADQKRVYVHDPKSTEQDGDHILTKPGFARLWTRAQCRGHLIAATGVHAVQEDWTIPERELSHNEPAEAQETAHLED